eukprot:scaffold1377_cov126-Cylindrotheca_fusiformis.AAC.12
MTCSLLSDTSPSRLDIDMTEPCLNTSTLLKNRPFKRSHNKSRSTSISSCQDCRYSYFKTLQHTMTPVVNRFTMGAKAAFRGTMFKKQMMEAQRFSTMTTGSRIRAYPFVHAASLDSYPSIQVDVVDRKRSEVQMKPKRSYGTAADIPEYVGRSAYSSLHEDYDHWNMHRNAGNKTKCNLGKLYDDEAPPAAAAVFATALTGNDVRVGDHSTFFEHDEDYYAKVERTLKLSEVGGTTYDDGNDQ